jgi:hypothetical protein
MAKMQARGGYQISIPPQIGGNIHEFLKYDDIAKAGAPTNFLGDALYDIGSGIAQMFEDEFSPEKKEIIEETDTFDPTDNVETPVENTSVPETQVENGVNKKTPPTTPQPQIQPVVTTQEITDVDETEIVYESDNQPPRTGQFGSANSSRRSEDYDDLKHRQMFAIPNKQKSSASSFGTDYFNLNKGFPRLSKEKTNENSVLQTLQAFAYPYKNTEQDSPLRRIAHVANSPFLKTDSLKYREMREMTYDPNKRGSIGTAFQEAFNVQVQKFNYGQKVKADFESAVGDEIGQLVVDVDKVDDQWQSSILATAQEMKSSLYNDYIDYINGDLSKVDYETKKLGYQSELGELRQGNDNLVKSAKVYAENKHLIDPDASDDAVMDFWNTREQAPGNIKIQKAENGVRYYTGETINGEYFQLPVSKIANGTSGMNLVMSANLSPDITKIVAGIKTIKEQTILENGYTMGNLKADDPRITNYSVSRLKSALNDESVLRSAAAKYGNLNSTAYAETIKDKEDRGALIQDLAEQIHTEVVVPQYIPEKRTYTTGSKSQKSTAGERTTAEIQKQINSFPTPTPENVISDWSTIIDKTKYKVQKADDDNYYITDLKNPPSILSQPFDFNKPNDIANIFANIAGIKGKQKLPYSLPK